MAPTLSIKHVVLLAVLILISLCFQGSVETPSTLLMISQEEVNDSLRSSSIQRSLETETEEHRTPIREDEFWLTESDSAILPFDVTFVPPDDSYGAFEPLWECDGSAESRDKKLVFVNVVRSDAMEVHELLHSYAESCHAGFASTVMCSGLSWESMKDTWANRRAKGRKSGVRCPLQKDSIDRNGQPFKDKKYMHAHILRESIDIAAGQIPIGSHEQWKNHQKEGVEAQYVVSLRCPYAWFVSSMIDKVKLDKEEETAEVDDVISAIKEKVESDLSSDMYHEVYARYLITPSQISWIQKEDADLGIHHRVDLSLTNLKKTNALILIAEDKAESLKKLKYLIDKNGLQTDLFSKAELQVQQERQGDPSVSTVMKALKEDTEFFQRLEEYLKYEAQIYKQAKEMHQKQVAWLQRNSEAELV